MVRTLRCTGCLMISSDSRVMNHASVHADSAWTFDSAQVIPVCSSANAAIPTRSPERILMKISKMRIVADRLETASVAAGPPASIHYASPKQ